MTDIRKFMNILNEEQVLDEMPIQHFQTIGDFSKGSSFHKPEDMKLVNNPKAVDKIHKKFAACDLDFNFYFVNDKEVRGHTEVGQVNDEWLQRNMPKAWAQIQPTISEDSINVIFTNNRGDERYPMTAWIIAHRLGHALRRNSGYQANQYFAELEKQFTYHVQQILKAFRVQAPSRGYSYGSDDQQVRRDYEKFSRNLFHAIGTMKSARDKNLRNSNEFIYEMIAQYIFTGQVTMNDSDGKLYSHSTWGTQQHRYAGRDSVEDLNELIQHFAGDMTGYIEQLLHSCVGGVFVM